MHPGGGFAQRGGFRSRQDGAIDTTTASGELMFNNFASLAQFERRLMQERTAAGLAAARARGRLGGRRPIRADDPRVAPPSGCTRTAASALFRSAGHWRFPGQRFTGILLCAKSPGKPMDKPRKGQQTCQPYAT